eukprot:3937754-Amphidinium_carterae.1
METTIKHLEGRQRLSEPRAIERKNKGRDVSSCEATHLDLASRSDLYLELAMIESDRCTHIREIMQGG